jgi:cytochrome c oxidase assembly protein subunit 15
LRALRFTALFAIVLTYALIILGGVVRTTGSGLSCPDWPTCYGHWIPLPADVAAVPNIGYSYGQVLLEWLHRLIAGVFLGPLVLAMALMAFGQRRRDAALPPIGAALLLLLLAQAGIGAFTVLDNNSPWSVAVHLGNALLLLTLMLLVVQRTEPTCPDRGDRRAALVAACAWLLALATMASAAMTSKSGAALACATWPSCDGLWLPDLSDPLVAIHFAHRVLAVATAVAVLLLWLASRSLQPASRRVAALALGLVAAQVALGALVIVWQVPLPTAVLHQAVGVLVFVLITRLLWRALASPPATRPESLDGLALRGT